MKKGVLLILGLLLGLAGYAGIYFWSTSSERDMLNHKTPELLWLKKEFNLGDSEYARICQVHESYLPRCQEMCRRIAEKNLELKRLLAQTNTVTPEIKRTLDEAAQIRADCQKAMLQHFYQVSQSMPPEQGKRYLAWIQEKTFSSQYGMMHESNSAGPAHERHH